MKKYTKVPLLIGLKQMYAVIMDEMELAKMDLDMEEKLERPIRTAFERLL